MVRIRYREQMFVDIAKAESEMYLSVAQQFAEEGETEMCSAVLSWASKAIADKSKLVARSH